MSVAVRLVGVCILFLVGSASRFSAQIQPGGLISAIVNETEVAAGERAKPGPRFVDVTPVLSELSRVLGRTVVPGDIGATLPETYSMAAKDSVLRCRSENRTDCAVLSGGVVIRVDSLSGDSSSVRAEVTWWDNATRRRGVESITWIVLLEHSENGWVPVKRTLFRMS